MGSAFEAVKGLWKSRWFAGFATAIVLFGAVTAVGLSFGGAGESAASPTGAGSHIRLLIPGITEGPRGNWIEIDSYQWGAQASSSRPPTGPPQTSEVVITKLVDAASPKLHLALARGEHLREVQVEMCQKDCLSRDVYVRVNMADVLVSGYSLSSGGDRPTESLSFNFTQITYEYFEMDKKNEPSGAVTWVCSPWPYCTEG